MLVSRTAARARLSIKKNSPAAAERFKNFKIFQFDYFFRKRRSSREKSVATGKFARKKRRSPAAPIRNSLIREARAAVSINCTARGAAFVVAARCWKKMTTSRNAAAVAGKARNILPAGNAKLN